MLQFWGCLLHILDYIVVKSAKYLRNAPQSSKITHLIDLVSKKIKCLKDRLLGGFPSTACSHQITLLYHIWSWYSGPIYFEPGLASKKWIIDCRDMRLNHFGYLCCRTFRYYPLSLHSSMAHLQSFHWAPSVATFFRPLWLLSIKWGHREASTCS